MLKVKKKSRFPSKVVFSCTVLFGHGTIIFGSINNYIVYSINKRRGRGGGS